MVMEGSRGEVRVAIGSSRRGEVWGQLGPFDAVDWVSVAV